MDQEWVEIQVPVVDAEATEIAGMLASTPAAAGGVELRPGMLVLWVAAVEAGRALAQVREAVALLERGGVSVRAAEVRVGPALAESAWRDAWKRHFGVTRIGRRIVLVPSWVRHVPAPTEVVIDIDPGRAFGTGAHPSTRLCLVELEMLAARPASPEGIRRILDCGTGSGILAIAAARLWPAASVVAVDVDPEAVEVAAENVHRNRLEAHVCCAATDAGALEGTFDVVVANIDREPLLALRETFQRLAGPAAVVILSGLLTTEAAAVAGAYAADGRLEVVRVPVSDADPEWSAAVLRGRPAPAAAQG